MNRAHTATTARLQRLTVWDELDTYNPVTSWWARLTDYAPPAPPAANLMAQERQKFRRVFGRIFGRVNRADDPQGEGVE